MFRFKVTKSEDTNVIEISRINKTDEKRLTPTIGKSTAILEKYNVSPTGKYQKVDKESLKLEW